MCAVYEATEEFSGLSDTPQLYPNPARDKVTIEGIETSEVQVYNAIGQMVKTVQGTNEIDLSGLVYGVYLMRIMDAKGRSHAERVVVKE